MTSTAIPGVIAGGQAWKVVWSWEGNNADGIIAISAAGVFYANPHGVVSQYGEGMAGANRIILSPDEKP